MRIENLLDILKQGEGETVEFKRKFSQSIAEDICAFANSSGGAIIVGVDDSGRIVGTSSKDFGKISNLLHTLSPMPKIRMDKIKVGGRLVIIIRVEKAPELTAFGNTAYIRVGNTNRALSLDEIILRYVERLRVRFDVLASPAKEKHLKREYLKWFLKKRAEIRRILPKGSLRENAVKLKAIVKRNGRYFLSNAGVLFFTEDPAAFIPGASSRIIVLNRENETVETKEFAGPVWKQIDDIYAFLLNNLPKMDIRTGTRRERILIYPEWSIREAIINAFSHRNYAIPSDIRIFIHPERLVIRSPGSFPPDFNIDEPEHIPKNPLLCEYLYSTGYIERYGYGIQKIMDECARHPVARVEFASTAYKVDVIFTKKLPGAVMDEKDRYIVTMVEKNKSLAEISGSLGMSRTAIWKRIKKLEALGILKKVARGKYIKRP
ncbi:MAG: putative DNA binding domain-containing protein [Candidatus Diapherotrites archaeon]|nr:putative DNA binding domain-containing protein [Candidatus Diapherotrites archaeon]